MIKNLILNLSLLLFCVLIYAQDYPKPDFKNQPMLYSEGKLSSLEKQVAENKIKIKGLGYGGSQQTISVPGPHSSVRVSNTPTFIIWVDEGVDPQSLIVFAKMDFKKKKRSLPMAKYSAFAAYGATGKSMSGKYHVDYDIKKVEDGVYAITVASELEPKMEYVFYNAEKTSAQQCIKIIANLRNSYASYTKRYVLYIQTLINSFNICPALIP